MSQLLGGDSAKKGADSATGGAILAGLVRPSQGTPGEYLVAETAFPASTAC